jgi:hypothetical protein
LASAWGIKKKGTKDQRVTDADDSSVNRSLRSTKPRIDTVSTTMCLALFSSPQKLKKFQDSLSHQILRHMNEALNIDENKN